MLLNSDNAINFIILSWPYVYWTMKRKEWKQVITAFVLSVVFVNYFHDHGEEQVSEFECFLLTTFPVVLLYAIQYFASKYIDLSIKEKK